MMPLISQRTDYGANVYSNSYSVICNSLLWPLFLLLRCSTRLFYLSISLLLALVPPPLGLSPVVSGVHVH